MIDAAIADGRPASFDLLGVEFCKEPPIQNPRGPEARFTNLLNFFKEITPEQMQSYAPDQIAAILRQREHLQGVLTRQQQMTGAGRQACYVPSSRSRTPGPPPGLGFPEAKQRPWVAADGDECQFKCCANCRPTSDLRSYLSLDAVVNGEYPPTAATGFGFHLQGSRPLIDARIVANIGYRPVPWVAIRYTMAWWRRRLLTIYKPPAFAHSRSVSSSSSIYDEDAYPEEPRFFPVMPSDGLSTSGGGDDPANRECVHLGPNGHGPSLVPGHPLPFASPETAKGSTAAPLDTDSSHDPTHIPSDAPRGIHACACATPLPTPEPTEAAYLHDESSLVMPKEPEEVCAPVEPLDVPGGLAVMEESVDLGIPDIVAQV